MIATDAELQRNAEQITRMHRIMERLSTTKAADSGLVYGVPERWLRRPDKLNRQDFQRLVEAARV